MKEYREEPLPDEKKGQFPAIVETDFRESRPDLATLSPEKRQRLWESYQKSFAETPKGLRADLIEQFLLHGVCSEEEAIQLIRQMDKEERGEVGEYVGQVLDAHLYPRLFQDNWYYLDTKAVIKFIHHFTESEPESAFLIAPFADLSRYVASEKEPGTAEHPSFLWQRYVPSDRPGKIQYPENSLLEWHFNNLDTAKPLFELCLEQPESPGTKAAVAFYKHKQPHFLFPYLGRLVKNGLLAEEEARTLLLGKEGEFSLYFKTDFYLSREERKKLEEIREVAKKHIGEKDVEIIGYWPTHLQEERDQLFCPAQKRMVAHLFENFQTSNTSLVENDRDKFFDHLIEGSLPFLGTLDTLDMSPTELKRCLGRAHATGEAVSLLDDLSDIATLAQNGREADAFLLLIKPLTDYDSNEVAKLIAKNADTVLPLFSSNQQERLIKTINQRYPDAWMYHFDYALTNGIVSPTYLKERADREAFTFLENYFSLWRFFQAAPKPSPGSPTQTEFGVKDLEELARDVLRKKPSLALYFPAHVKSLFGAESKNFIAEALTGNPPDIDLVGQAMSALSREESAKDFLQDAGLTFDEAIQALRSIAKSHLPLVEEILCGWSGTWDVFTRLTSSKTRLEVLERISSSGEMNEMINLSSDAIVKDLMRRPKDFETFTSRLIQDECIEAAFKVVQNLHAAIEGKFVLKKEDALSDDQRRTYLFQREALLEKLREVCSGKPEYLFLAELRDGQLERGMTEPAALEYLADHPQVTLRLNNRAMGSTTYNELVQHNARVFAFLPDRSGYFSAPDVSAETTNHLIDLNPLIPLMQEKKLLKDYYDEAIDIVATNPFYPAYQSRLQELAAQEQEKNGPQTQMKYFAPQNEFREITHRILLLSSVPEVLATQREILALPESIRETFLKTLESLLISSVDKRLGQEFQAALDALKTSPADSLQQLQKLLWNYAERLCGQTAYTERAPHDVPPDATQALVTYYTTTCSQSREAKEIFREFIECTSRGNFLSWRSWNSEHCREHGEKLEALKAMKAQGLLPRELSLSQYEAWQKTQESGFNEVMRLDETDIRSTVRRILSQAAADLHIKPEDIPRDFAIAKERFDSLYSPIADWGARVHELSTKAKLAKKKKDEPLTSEESLELRDLQKMIATYKEEHAVEFEKAEAELYVSRLPHLTLGEIENQALFVSGKNVDLKHVFKILQSAYEEANPEFLQDIRRIQSLLYDTFHEVFSDRKVSRSSLTMTDNVDLKTYIKVGEEPVPSCQSYLSKSNLNIGLLSYMLDPNVKIIQMRNESGTLIARSVLRLLEDENGKPQLFLERVYSTNAHQKIVEAIVSFARAKAKTIGCALYSHGAEGADESTITDNRKLLSRGSRSPYVYTDAGGGKMRKGEFTIDNAFKIGS